MNWYLTRGLTKIRSLHIPLDNNNHITYKKMNTDIMSCTISALTAPDNITKYNYKDRVFKVDPPGPLDHLAVHFSIDGASIHVNSDEAKEQITCNERREEEMASKQNAAAARSTTEEEGDMNWVREMDGMESQSVSQSVSLFVSLLLLMASYVIFNALRNRNQYATRVKISSTLVRGQYKQSTIH